MRAGRSRRIRTFTWRPARSARSAIACGWRTVRAGRTGFSRSYLLGPVGSPTTTAVTPRLARGLRMFRTACIHRCLCADGDRVRRLRLGFSGALYGAVGARMTFTLRGSPRASAG